MRVTGKEKEKNIYSMNVGQERNTRKNTLSRGRVDAVEQELNTNGFADHCLSVQHHITTEDSGGVEEGAGEEPASVDGVVRIQQRESAEQTR
jgi:hypothetical protein